MRNLLFIYVLTLASVIGVSRQQTLEKETCDSQRLVVDVSTSNANAILGGIFDLRQAGLADNGYGCAQPHPDFILSYEAARYAIKQINDQQYIPGVRLGMKAYDTCNSPARAQAAAQNFYPQTASGSMYCNQSQKINLGILGSLRSSTSKPLAELTSTIPVSMISPRAASPVLSLKSKYPYFMRTGSSATQHIRVISTLLKDFGWERVVLVSTMTDYGMDYNTEFIRMAKKMGICIVNEFSVPQQGTASDYVTQLRGIGSYGVAAAVYFGEDESMNNIFNALSNVTGSENLQWVLSSYRTNSRPTQIYARGAIVVQPKFTNVTDFYDYFVNNLNENNPPPENPWLQEWYMTTFGCRLTGINYAPYNQSANCTLKTNDEKKAMLNQDYPFVDSTIMAVYAYAKALKQAQAVECGIGGGICSALQEMRPKQFHENYLSKVDFMFDTTMVRSLENVRVRFDGNGDLVTSDFFIWNYNDLRGPFQFVQVGSYQSGQLTINNSSLKFYTMGGNPSSRCPPEGCQQCLIPPDMINFEYEPGDILIGGVFSIHNAGEEPLSCGSLHLSNIYNAVAFRYAIQMAKSSIPNVGLGSLLADVCGSGMSGRLFFDNLLGERQIVRDNMGRVIDPNQFKAVVGYQNSDAAMKLAEMFGGFYTPYVDTSASSMVLSSKEMFPYFNRAIPPDSKQVMAMVQLLRRLGWTYIQTIQAPNSYGRLGINYLRESAAYYGICVTESYEIGTDGNYTDIVSKLNNKPDARAVVVFAYATDFRGLLQALKARNVPGQFILIGSETWGTDSRITAGLEDIASGSMTFQVETSTSQGFSNWLGALNPQDPKIQNDMPFFVEWYQYAHNCYIDAANRGQYISQCTSTPITAGQNFHVDQYSYFVINAVKAVVKALDNTIKFFCGNGYTQVCSAFRSNVTAKDILLANIRNISINTEDNKLFEIMNGEGTADYIVYNYVQGRGYEQAGIFDTATNLLNLNMAAVTLPTPTFTSRCALRCGECAYTLQQLPFIIDQWTDIKLGVSLAASDPSSDPFLCGNVRLGDGVQNFYATSYALDVINRKLGPVKLNGVKLGALFMDNCNSQARAYVLPNALYAGILKSPSQIEPMPSLDTVRGWMTHNTLGAQELKDLVKSMNLPLISPSATSTSLVNDNQFPTFYRTVKGDNTVSSAMAKLLKSLDFPYVSVLYSANDFGRSGRDAFISVASQEGICILQSYEITQNVNVTDLVTTLISQPSHVVIAYLTSRDIQAFLEARKSNPMGYKIVVISPEPWTMLMKRLGNAGQNMLSVKVKSKYLDDFRQFIDQTPLLTRIDNPYLVKYYEDFFTCNLPGNHRYAVDCTIPLAPISSSPLFVQEDYVIPIINAVYAWATAIEATLREKCGDTYNGVCTCFLKDNDTNIILLNKLQRVSFMDPNGDMFTFKNREGSTGHEIHLYDGNQYKKVGEFAGASVQITAPDLLKRFEGTESTCPTPCIQCIQNTMEFTYIPGDIILGGLFDVHNAALAPFSCGSIKTWHGFQLLEAFHYAINKVNDKSGQFANVMKNVKLGGIGLDSCESAIRSGFLISNIHNGLSVLQRGDATINPDDINVYVGSYSSGQSIHVARLLKTLKIPQISYGSTSMTLADADRFPYFLRTVPGDEKQSIAMIEFLNKFDIRYVQIVHTSSNYGEQGAAIFSKVAKERSKKICVAQTVVFPDNGTVSQESANDVVTALLNKPVANTVIIFADTSYINELLLAIRRKPEAANKFRFIGSDTWANNPEAIAGVESIANKSVTIDLEFLDINDFDTYLSTKTPDNYPENPWFPEYYQEMENCYLSSVDRRYPQRCPSIPGNIVVSQRYKQDTVILHVINAVYAAAYGIDKALREVCGNDYTTVCEPFKNHQDRRDVILRNIKKAEFVDPSGQNFHFVNGTDGNKGYVMYSIEPSVTFGYVYTQVGMYNNMGVLAMAPRYTPPWDGSCTRLDSCLECPTVRNTLSRYMLQPHAGGTGNPATIVAFMNVHESARLNTYRCGAIHATSDFLNALAFFYILDKHLDGFRAFDVRGLVIDLCDQAVRVNQDAYSLLSSGTLCNSDFDPAGKVMNKSTIAAFVTPGSVSSVEANRVLSPLQISFISYSASSVALKDQEQYPYFARVIPPDDKQSLIIAQILKRMQWDYISVVYSKEPYGISGESALRQKVYDLQASCIALSVPISRLATLEEAKDVVRQLIDKAGADVVVLFTVNPDVVLKAANALGVLNKFLWIGSDTWGSSLEPVTGLESKIIGSITIEFRNAQVKEFTDWVGSLSYTNRYFIPDDWFEEFYQVMNECYLHDAVVVRHEFGTLCRTNERIDISKIPPQQLLSTMAATYAIKKGLYDFQQGFCGTQSFTQCLEKVTSAREKIFQKILASEWQIDKNLTLMPNENFYLKFNSERYWNVGYKINQFVRNGSNFTYREIGRQIGDDPFQLLNVQMYREVVSMCPAGEDCNCNLPSSAGFQAQTANNSISKISKEPRNFFLYNEATRDKVYVWPVWAIVLAVLSCLGLIVGMILFFYFLVSYPVKGGTSSLGFLVIFGILCIYATNFAFYFPASQASCGARRFLMGVVYSIIFSALFIKALDNWRFSGTEYSVRQYHGITSSCSLFLMALGISCIEVIIPLEWLILVNPTASKVADNTTNDWMWCDPVEHSDLHLVVSMYFVGALLILTAIFSALSWDSESNYYESRWIFVSTVCTAGCLLVWMIVSTNARPLYRDPAIVIANFVNATALLICIPLRKLVLLYYVHNYEEKERALQPDDQGHDLYSTEYNNQVFEPDIFQNIDSKHESEHEFLVLVCVASFSNQEILTLTDPSYKPTWDGSCNKPDACSECPTVRNIISRYMLQPSLASNPATIVALLNTHMSAGGIYTYRCGAIYHETGFMNALAFFYTLQNKVPRAFDVRGLVINQCGNPLRADQDIYNLLSKGKLCNTDFDTGGQIIDNSTVVGFITPGSRNTEAANRVLAPLKVPLVSFTATSSLLNDIETYPYLARVVPPDENQLRIIAQILKQMGWNYISVVYTTEPVGRTGVQRLRKSIEDLGSSTCIGLAIAMPETATIEKGKEIVQQLLAQDGADVVVLISVKPQTITLAANALGVADKFRFIGLDIWGSLMFPVQGFEDKMLGSITVEFRNAEIEDFGRWLETLDFNHKSFIPNDWFEEFYQAWFKCYLPNALVVRSEFTVPCRTDLKFDRKLIQPRVLLYMIAATYAVAEGLDNFRSTYCKSTWTFSECLQSVSNSRDALFQSILAVKWEMEKSLELIPNEEYHLNFTKERYWDSGYKVNVLMKNTTTGTYFYKEFGREIRGVLNLSTYQGFRKVVSTCPAGRDCKCVVDVGGQAQEQQGQYYSKKEEPRNYFFYDDNTGEKIYTWPIWAIVVAVLTCVGLLIGILLFFYFLFVYPIHGGTTSLGFLLIFGILCIYAINFAFFYPASEETCGARRFCMGVVYAIAFAALFIKAVDNFRFSETEYSVRQYKGLTSSFSLFVMAIGIILIEVIIPVEWLILVNPTATKMSENPRHDWMWCDPTNFYDRSLVLSMIFVMVLILLTAIFAALSWDSDSNYYESRWILLSSISTAGCFLVWMIVSTSARPPYRDPAIAIANLVNATALLICMPIRKLVLLCYVKNYEEREKMQPAVEPGHDLYSTVYPNQAYEPDVFQNVESKYDSEQSY